VHTDMSMNEENPEEGAARFITQSRLTAQKNGAVVFEYFKCPHCTFDQVTTHQFAESVPCVKCKKRMASVVPRISQPGEVSVDTLYEAIQLVRSIFPVIPDPTQEWLAKQEGHVRVVGEAIGNIHAHYALDKVEEVARKLTGGHNIGA